MRLLLIITSSVIAACQCFVPVDERPDAGRVDAGSVDAGLINRDAGFVPDGGFECLTAADCTGTPWARRWCFGIDAGFTCVVNRCVSQCEGESGRTCTPDAGGDCLECSGTPALCAADTCPTDAFSGTISSVECRPGVMAPLALGDALSFVPIRGASCEMSVSGPARGLGQVVRDRFAANHFWFIRELGGTCVGAALPTGAIRSSVACPLCSFTVEGF